MPRSPRDLVSARLKIELDDLSLKYLEPDIYYDLVDKIAVRKSVSVKNISRVLWMKSVNIW